MTFVVCFGKSFTEWLLKYFIVLKTADLVIKQLILQNNMEYIRVGDHIIEYSKDFKLYITTRLRNPHYLPEVSVKVSLFSALSENMYVDL